MKCSDCDNEKVIEQINILIFNKPICQDCVDYRENMALAQKVKERFDDIAKQMEIIKNGSRELDSKIESLAKKFK
ncbi:hypothetical protein P4V41_07595 [Fictibacillus nanhaiensis]|uniref:hypothetical protein n=1 Tax=Fictibacillus nanhaiensis TaxID=742169 RepID=UPI002E23CCBC|nr:hypothetical protein [Fictibacillus nanhaiensis]